MNCGTGRAKRLGILRLGEAPSLTVEHTGSFKDNSSTPTTFQKIDINWYSYVSNTGREDDAGTAPRDLLKSG